MVTLELPLLVIVTFCELELPTLMPVKLKLAGFADSVTVAAAAVPVSAMVLGEFGALLVMVMVPVAPPAVVGANSTLNEAVPPAATVAGVVSPLTLKLPPVTEICEIVREAVPVFVRVKDCDLVCPSTMLPKP
jgi:hypothetical protein